MDLLTLGAAFLAGVLTILSPCILPILPIVVGAASSEHRLGPVALALGLATGFAALGLFIATIGFSLGLDPTIFRTTSAILLLGFGLILLIPAAQRQMQAMLAPVGTWASNRTSGVRGGGFAGQYGLGLLLGAVWSPCVGPTLGAATLLASQGEALGEAGLVMLVFGIGISIPLLAIGLAGRQVMARMRGGLGKAAGYGKLLLGLGMVIAAVLVAEIWFLDHGPAWATTWSTRF
jgi:cytochrome c-type biogenesis protein